MALINYRRFGRSSAVETNGNDILSDDSRVREERESKQFLRDDLPRVGEKKLAANVAFKHHSSRRPGNCVQTLGAGSGMRETE